MYTWNTKWPWNDRLFAAEARATDEGFILPLPIAGGPPPGAAFPFPVDCGPKAAPTPTPAPVPVPVLAPVFVPVPTPVPALPVAVRCCSRSLRPV